MSDGRVSSESRRQKLMTKEKRDELVSELLIELNDVVDASGNPIGVQRFMFSEDQSSELLESLQIDFHELTILLDLCISRRYLKHSAMGGGKYGCLTLTEEGQGRAISVEASRLNSAPIRRNDTSIRIDTLNANAAMVGSNNTLNIQDFSASLIEKIDRADAPEQDKEEAKNRLKSFLKHPLVVALFGSGVSAAVALLGGE